MALKQIFYFCVCFCVCFCEVVVQVNEARADKFDNTLDINFQLTAGPTDGSGFQLRGRGSDPTKADAFIKDYGVSLKGDGVVSGMTVRFGMSLDGWRLGGALGGFGLEQLTWTHTPFEGGGRMSARGWGLWSEIYAGYAFGDVRGVRVYGDVCGRTLAGFLDVEASSLGNVKLSVIDPSQVTLRGGVLIWVNEYVFLDFALEGSVLGSDLAALTLGVGLPVPLDNL